MTFKINPAIADLNPRVTQIKGTSKGPSETGWPNTKTRADDWLKENGGDLQFERFNEDRYGVVLDSDMLVLDVDCHDGQANGFESLTKLVDDGGPDLFEQASLVVRSPSGGCHLYFKKSKFIKFPGSCKRYPALDWLSSGKQVIGPGSKHVDGGEYVVERNRGELTEIDYSVLGYLTSPKPEIVDYGPADRPSVAGETPSDAFNRSEKGVDIIRSEMEGLGYTFSRKEDHWVFCRPNKTDFSNAISGTLGRRTKSGNYFLRNWSTSDCTFPADEAVTIVEAYRLLHNMHHSDIPPVLSTMGFGDQKPQMSNAEFESIRKSLMSGKELEEKYPTRTFEELVRDAGGKRKEWLIEGLMRKDETMNVIASPKAGKSWLVHGLAIAVANGNKFLGFQASQKLKVLIVDNELHDEELAWRVGQVAKASGVKLKDSLHFTTLRGSNVDIDGLEKKLEEVGAERFDIIVIDAFYRILPKGVSENSNSDITGIFNQLDRMASRYSCGIINIHHASKGEQGSKSVTDMGSGAGAISRAADTHLTIREHVDDGLFVINAVTRSGISPDPITAKLEWPLWKLVEDVEPTLKTFENSRKKNNKSAVDDVAEKKEIIVNWISENSGDQNGIKNVVQIYDELKLETWPNRQTFSKHLNALCDEGRLKKLPPDGGGRANRFIAI